MRQPNKLFLSVTLKKLKVVEIMISELNQRNPYYLLNSPKKASLAQSPLISSFSGSVKPYRLSLDTLKPYSAALIPFGYNFLLKSEKGLPCPCCGIIMTTNEEINEFVKDMDGATGSKIIEGIEKYEERLPETERSVSNRLKIEAAKFENLDLNGLLNKINQEPKKELELKQKKILNEMQNLADQLTGDTYNIIQKDVNAINNIITEGKNGKPFKRKTLIQGMEKVRDNETDSNNRLILEKIVEKTLDMPTSSTDADAFIVKYSRRTTPEIARRIIEPSQATAEHIKPHSKNGNDGPDNYLSECKKCNNDRDTMTYVEWLKIHPEMISNTQKYMDEVVNRIIDGRIRGFEFYPRAVKNALYTESGGQIDLDISKFIAYRIKTKNEKQATVATGTNLNKVI